MVVEFLYLVGEFVVNVARFRMTEILIFIVLILSVSIFIEKRDCEKSGFKYSFDYGCIKGRNENNNESKTI